MGNSPAQNQRIKYSTKTHEGHRVLGPFLRVRVEFGGKEQQCIMTHSHNLEVQQINKNITWMMSKQNHPSCKYVLKKIYAQEGICSNGLCSMTKMGEVFYQGFQHDLEEEFWRGKLGRKTFAEKNILEVVEHCVMALRLQEDLNIKFHHICRQSVLKGKKGYMLVAGEDANIEHPLIDYLGQFQSEKLGKSHWISPQLLEGVENREHLPVTVKDQIFALGGTVLSLCVMGDVSFESEAVGVSEEGDKGFVFSEERMKEQLKKARKIISEMNYPQKVKCLILGMIEYKRQNRLCPDQILKLLNQTPLRRKSIDTSHIYPNNKSKTKPSPLTTPSNKENYCTTDMLKTHRKNYSSFESNKKVIDVYLDARHLFEESKSTIATNPKHYKNAKMGKKDNLEDAVQKEVLSEIRSSGSMFTPIKELTKMEGTSRQMKRGGSAKQNPWQTMPITESKYEICSELIQRQQSKTSLALNLISKFHIDPSDSQMRRPL